MFALFPKVRGRKWWKQRLWIVPPKCHCPQSHLPLPAPPGRAGSKVRSRGVQFQKENFGTFGKLL